MEKETFWYKAGKIIRSGENKEIQPVLTSDAIKEARQLRKISHYTNIDSLLKILKYKTILFNRIDRVNDREETKGLQVNLLENRIFVSCFNHSSYESIPLWYIYTKKGMGVRISFCFKEDREIESLFDREKDCETNIPLKLCSWNKEKSVAYGFIEKFKCQNVIYSFDEEYEQGVYMGRDESGISYNWGAMAAYKDSEWKYEEETRFIALVSPANDNFEYTINNINYILLSMDISAFNKIEIVFDPWMQSEIIDCVKHEIDLYELEIPVEYMESKFKDKIYRQ